MLPNRKSTFKRTFSRGFSAGGSRTSSRASYRSSPTRPGSTAKKINTSMPTIDPEAEARDKLLHALLQKRRVMMSEFRDEDLRDIDDVVKYGPPDHPEVDSNAPMIIRIRNALGTKPIQRIHAYDQTIIEMLKHTPKLNESLKFCSESDLLTLSKMCTSFVVSSDSQHVLTTAGSVVDELYIVIKGCVDRYQNPALTEADLEATVEAIGEPVKLEGWVESVGVASALGLNVLQNNFKWDSDYVARNGTCICTLPVRVLLQFVGMPGFRGEDAMECFWRYYKLWEYIYDSEKKGMLPADPLFAHPATFHPDFEHIVAPPPLPINVTACARIRHFSPGQEIFAQGAPRDFLYIILVGEGTYVRRFPDWVEDIPVEVKMGITVYPGDFSFMDGEDGEWAGRNRKAYLEQSHLQGEINETEEYEFQHSDAYRLLFAAKIRNRDQLKNRYGVHKSTLLATTRVEVCVVPLASVAEAQNAFRGLLRVANSKYRLLNYSDEDLIRRYHENRIWRAQKTRIIGKALGVDLQPPQPAVPVAKQRSNSARMSSDIGTGTGTAESPSRASSKPLPTYMGSGDALDEDEIDVELNDKIVSPRSAPASTQPLISLLNPRNYIANKNITKPSSAGKVSVESSSVPEQSKEKKRETRRQAIQGALMDAEVSDPSTIRKAANRSPISRSNSRNRSQGASSSSSVSGRGSALSDRINSFVRATANASPAAPGPRYPEPSLPTGSKNSNKSVRTRKVSEQHKQQRNNRSMSTSSEIDNVPRRGSSRRKMLSFIQEGLNEHSIAEGSTTSSVVKVDSISEAGEKIGGGIPRKKVISREAPNVRIDESELSLQAYAEKNADYYVQQFRKKKADMKQKSGTPDFLKLMHSTNSGNTSHNATASNGNDSHHSRAARGDASVNSATADLSYRGSGNTSTNGGTRGYWQTPAAAYDHISVAVRVRRYPPRESRPSKGDISGLDLFKDAITVGRIPDNLKQSEHKEHIRHEDDYRHTWVAPSVHCDGGGLGYFFRVPQGRTLPAGYLLGVYYGDDNKGASKNYKAYLKKFIGSDYTLSYPPSHYVVDGSPTCGPARTNEGFNNFNCYLTYNAQAHRMELRTKAPMRSGSYEALTNYDIPGCPPSYWAAKDRQAKLPAETGRVCAAYYPTKAAPPRSTASAPPSPRPIPPLPSPEGETAQCTPPDMSTPDSPKSSPTPLNWHPRDAGPSSQVYI